MEYLFHYFAIIIVFTLTIIIHYFTYHRLKNSTSEHLSELHEEIAKQELLCSKLENRLIKSGDLESRNQAKLDYIKIEIIQIDHSLLEICMFI